MKQTIDHLPEQKQRELAAIVEAVREAPGLAMVILFGSYARGDWVEDEYEEGHITYSYQSDYDLLLVFRKIKQANNFQHRRQVEAAIRETAVPTPVNIIYHGLSFVNKKISAGNYFFTDIVREGVMLFDSGKEQLAEIRELPPQQRKANAERDFKNWFESAGEFLISAKSNIERGSLKLAAFELHQTVERLYTASLLVYYGYRPKSHDIRILGRLLSTIDVHLVLKEGQPDTFEGSSFNLLRRAYVEARYNMDFEIERKTCDFLVNQIVTLSNAVQRVCLQRIEHM